MQDNMYAIEDAEDFIVSVSGDVSAISAEIDYSQTRREAARQNGWDATITYERAYERRLRQAIQQD